jgi:hypothetical protein
VSECYEPDKENLAEADGNNAVLWKGGEDAIKSGSSAKARHYI